jgi:hypothetical protein
MVLRREITRRVILGSTPFFFCFFFSLFISVNLLITLEWGCLYFDEGLISFTFPIHPLWSG